MIEVITLGWSWLAFRGDTGRRGNPREAHTFAAIHAAVSTGMKHGDPLQRQLTEAFNHVIKTLKVEQILESWGVSETDGTASAGDIARAKLMHGFLVGATGIRRSADGRSDLLASFLALSLVDPDLREVLGRMPPPKVLAMSWASVDDWLRSLATAVVNLLTRASLHPRRMAPDMRREMDLLGEALSEIQADRRFLAAFDRMGELTDKANAVAADWIRTGAEKTTAKIETLKALGPVPQEIAQSAQEA
ncbi:hypothetical protein [uncultured Paracoccus sp.]|uniref:hypothetical protein n=1 Tax=uncultured Paracoccus sp. TaxID=189685 RepID=UPI002631B29F|nr:hypothetical protein [uncultured Paracoccus sp.]